MSKNIKPICHCEPAKGGRGNLPLFVIARLPIREAVAISIFKNDPRCHCELPVREAWQSLRKRKQKRDCFAIARNDKKVSIASLLAMTKMRKPLRSSQ